MSLENIELRTTKKVIDPYYDWERMELEKRVKKDTKKGNGERRLISYRGENGVLYAEVGTDGEEIPVAFSNERMVIRMGDEVLFKRSSTRADIYMDMVVVDSLSFDVETGLINIYINGPKSGTESSTFKLEDASINRSAEGRYSEMLA